MDNTMEDYYKVLQYLRETHIDRRYPYEFEYIDYVLPKEQCELVEEHHSDFSNSLKVTGISEGQKVMIQLPVVRDYVDIDTFEILFYSDTEILPSDVEIGFSNTRSGVVNQLVLTEDDIYNEDSFISEEGYSQFKYLVRKTNTKMQKKSRKISSVHCINIKFNKAVDEIYISNLVARTDQFTITLEDLDEQIIMGKKYVANQLLIEDIEDIPSFLEFLCFKGAGAYSWLIWFENEGKVMDDGTKQGRNYATRLLEDIDRFIENYLKSQEEEDKTKWIDGKIADYRDFCEFDSSCKHTKNCRTKKVYYKGVLVR